MSQLRQNMVTKEWVIIATERANRPDDFAESVSHRLTDESPPHDPDCPFCVENEELDLETGRIPPTGDWRVRAVRNRYPALLQDKELVRTYDGVQRSISGVGIHEVVIEHPRHNTTPALMELQDLEAVFEMFYNRGWDIQSDSRMEHIVYFKNHGARAGASLSHSHSQIIALPVVPADIRRHSDEARRYFDDTGQCVFCVMLQDELRKKTRLVSVTDHFAAFVLYAAPFPFTMWIIPRQHSVSFLYSHEVERVDLALIVRDVLRRLFVGLRDPAYNLIIRTAPVKQLDSEYLHWYIVVIPRLKKLAAGFELGSGMFINPSLPEDCAAFLRDVSI